MGQLHPMNSSYNTNLWWSNCQDVVLGLLMVPLTTYGKMSRLSKQQSMGSLKVQNNIVDKIMFPHYHHSSIGTVTCTVYWKMRLHTNNILLACRRPDSLKSGGNTPSKRNLSNSRDVGMCSLDQERQLCLYTP